ncbi:MAG: c-type cytochrome [Chitinophagaceae bacterium]
MKTAIQYCTLFLSTCLLFINCGTKKENIVFDANNGGLFLPDGFGAVVVADSIGPSRHIAVKENGDIYVKLKITSDASGSVALRDEDGDGKADIIQPFGKYVNDGIFATGMRIHNGYLYYSTEKVVYRQKIDNDLVPTSKQEIVLMDESDQWHIAKPIAFDKEGNMYVPYSAPSNACASFINTTGTSVQQAGQYPCPELVNHGGIWKFKANAINQTQKDGVQIGTGLRSIVAMNFNTSNNTLYAVQHGRDDLHLLWPNLYSAWQNAVTPAEEFFEIKEGNQYGWPYSYFDPVTKQKLQAPEYGGDGKKLATDQSFTNPLAAFPAHWAPNDLLFYQGDQFPARYKNGAFIAFHGSTNRGPYPQAGYIVAFIPFSNGKPSGAWEVFADGFAGVDTIVNVSDARYRPMGLAEGPDGSLYISDSKKGKIWRILYKEDKTKFNNTALASMEQRKNIATNIKTPDPIKDIIQIKYSKVGQTIYQTNCTNCHQANLKGDGNRYPSLIKSNYLNDKSSFRNLIYNGKGNMPGFKQLSSKEIDELETYIQSVISKQ